MYGSRFRPMPQMLPALRSNARLAKVRRSCLCSLCFLGFAMLGASRNLRVLLLVLVGHSIFKLFAFSGVRGPRTSCLAPLVLIAAVAYDYDEETGGVRCWPGLGFLCGNYCCTVNLSLTCGTRTQNSARCFRCSLPYPVPQSTLQCKTAVLEAP